MGMVAHAIFYNYQLHETLATAFCDSNIAYFPFHNRGAHYVQKLHKPTPEGEERALYGMAYERIDECVHDINGAITLLQEKGYTELYLLGFSTGANKICVYNFHKPHNAIKGYILACGGFFARIYQVFIE